MMYTKEMLQQQMRDMGLISSDTVLIHTSFKAVGAVEGGPDAFLDAFCEYLSAGRFIVPTHTWSVVNAGQPVYDAAKTVPNIGLIPRTAAFRTDGIRSLHPTHSVWVHAKDAADYVKGEELAETPAPVGGAWSRLADTGAKILLIGVGHERDTFIHAIDEVADIPNRLQDKTYDVTIIDGDKTYCHPFRGHKGAVSDYFGNFEPAIEALGAQTHGKLGDADVLVVDAAAMQKIILRIYERADFDPCDGVQNLPETLWMP